MTRGSKIDRAMQSFPAAFRQLYDPEFVRSICVGRHAGKDGYIVRLRSSAQRAQRLRTFGDIPVLYRGGATDEDVGVIAEKSDGIIAALGDGIYNGAPDYSASEPLRHNRSLGTLGAFVQVSGGSDRAILSSALALARNARSHDFAFGSTGDSIVVESSDESPTILAKYEKNVPMPPYDVHEKNFIEAVAKLDAKWKLSKQGVLTKLFQQFQCLADLRRTRFRRCLGHWQFGEPCLHRRLPLL